MPAQCLPQMKPRGFRHKAGNAPCPGCVYKDCNIDKLEKDEGRGLYARDNYFDRPPEERRAELEIRLAQY